MFYIGNNTVDLRIESINPLRIEILDLVRAFAVLATPALRFGEFLFLEISEFLSYSQGLSGAKDNFRFFDQAGGKFLGGRGSRRAYPKTEIAQFAYIHPAPLREISFQHDIDTVEYRLDLGGACLSAINAENQQIAKQTPDFTPKNVKLGVFVLFKIYSSIILLPLLLERGGFFFVRT